jgi:hypothetical protein
VLQPTAPPHTPKVKINRHLSDEHKINHGVRQNCPLSPASSNIYMNAMIVKWKQIYRKVLLYRPLKMNPVPTVDGQVIIADSEDNLRRGVFTLQNTAKVWNGNITRRI